MSLTPLFWLFLGTLFAGAAIACGILGAYGAAFWTVLFSVMSFVILGWELEAIDPNKVG